MTIEDIHIWDKIIIEWEVVIIKELRPFWIEYEYEKNLIEWYTIYENIL